MGFFRECDECQGTGSIYVGPGSRLDEDSYEECPECHGRGGYYEEEDIAGEEDGNPAGS